MTNFLHVATGVLPGGYPWSIRAVSTSSATEAAAEAAWHAGWAAIFGTTALAAFYNTLTTFNGTATSTADTSFRQTTITRTSASVPGTSASESLPFQSAPIVTLRTAFATRWGRGRWYLPAPASNALATTGPFLSTAFETALAGAVGSAFVSNWAPVIALQILHRKAAKSGLPSAMTTSPVTGCDVSNKLAVQRRRGDKFLPTRTTVTI